MSPSVKTNNPLRDKLDDDTLDLSLSQMNEVTEDVVRDIVRLMNDMRLVVDRIWLISSHFSRCCPRGPTSTCPTICSCACR